MSVIIPLYNKDKYIARAVDSVLAQEYANYDLIIVDDGSTDKGPNIVSQYTDSRIKIIRQQNAGPGAARNRGIANSSGELLAFLDADDEWLPQFLSTSVHLLLDNPDCALSITGYFEGEKRQSKETWLHERGITEGPWRMPTNISPEKMVKLFGQFFNSWAIVCKRSVVEQFGGYYHKHNCKHGEDMYLWLQVVLHYKVYRHPKPLVWYHTEASELDRGPDINFDLRPILTDPQPIRYNCPEEYRCLLEKWLSFRALRTARIMVAIGKNNVAKNLLRQFPEAKKRKWDYWNTRIRIWCSPLRRFIRPQI